jgi:ADP-ribosylglycohydrolase
MLGAIIGDIVGSIYEWQNIKTKDFVLFGEHCIFTDDTVMSVAVAEGLMNGGASDDYIKAMKRLGRMYLHVGYGKSFRGWLTADNSDPYNSWGNGSAMRVSPIGWSFDTLEKTENAAEVSASVTHNHPEGIKGAQATAAAIFLARTGKSKDEIRSYIERRFDYSLNRTLDEIRPAYKFDVSCMGTVPEAIIAFLESADFEDSIRNAISLGGDSDTLAAITGSIAEAAYIIPKSISDKALSLLDAPLLEVLNRWQNRGEKSCLE